VSLSVLYGTPVRLYDLGIKNCSFGVRISKEKFREIKQSAGEMKEYRQ
jgi:hypothetical protein